MGGTIMEEEEEEDDDDDDGDDDDDDERTTTASARCPCSSPLFGAAADNRVVPRFPWTTCDGIKE